MHRVDRIIGFDISIVIKTDIIKLNKKQHPSLKRPKDIAISTIYQAESIQRAIVVAKPWLEIRSSGPSSCLCVTFPCALLGLTAGFRGRSVSSRRIIRARRNQVVPTWSSGPLRPPTSSSFGGSSGRRRRRRTWLRRRDQAGHAWRVDRDRRSAGIDGVLRSNGGWRRDHIPSLRRDDHRAWAR